MLLVQCDYNPALSVMADALISYFRQSLPAEVADLTEPYIAKLEQGDYQGLLQGPDARLLFCHGDDVKTQDSKLSDFPNWNDFIFHRLGILLADRSKPQKQYIFFCIGYAALLSFLQSSVTGPRLPFDPGKVLLPAKVTAKERQNLRVALLETLSIDGIAAYKLTPNAELLCLADAIFTCPPILKNIKVARWAKMRAAFTHQRLLSEVSATLQEVIYEDLEMLQETVMGSNEIPGLGMEAVSEFLIERATIHTHHGLDRLARTDLEKAKEIRRFNFALTGLLGKRTKFQQHDISQLVVLAKSDDSGEPARETASLDQANRRIENGDDTISPRSWKPTSVDLNDDTLLESISFAERSDNSTQTLDQSKLPAELTSIDPSNQPQLQPLDSAMLLALASSITNTSPQHGLTREETLPYATRVLEGGSSNWQVYTQALLVRSRIEGYQARTVERGLLQLQALVDQVITGTTAASSGVDGKVDGNSAEMQSFLPRANESESATAQDRLRYIFQLASPMQWDLEAELAKR